MLSGREWANRFPTSKSIRDLGPGFRPRIERFISSLESGGARVRINATTRPPERAYLMHYAWRIARENLSPDKVPDMPGVDIQWSHTRPDGDMDTLKSRMAAEQMVQAFEIVFKPALTSKHTEGAAIDMTVTGYLKKSFVNANQQSVELKSHSDLHRLGASFGVHKLVSDPPHWSDDGR